MNDATIDQYHDLEVAHRHGDTLVLRAVAADGTRVLIKTHAHPLPTDETRARLRREYLSASAVDHPHLVAVRELIDEPRRAALVLRDQGGVPLADLIEFGGDENAIDVDRLVGVAVEVGLAAGALHIAGFVHGAIDARHIEITDRAATLADLYDACAVGSPPRRHSSGDHPPPERLSSVIDAADPVSDQFALSRTVTDTAERLDLDLPDALAAILGRAARPDPTERYRSMLGFVADLRRWLERRESTPFELAADDVNLTWRPPDRMIGRAGVLASLLDVIDDAGHGRTSRVVVIHGAAGSGRTTLLATLADELARRGVVAGLGRFDPGGADPPLRAPIDAMRQIVDQILAAPQSLVDAIRTELTDRLGPDVALAAQILPSLHHLVGGGPPQRDTAPVELIARVEQAVLSTVGSIARHLVPLVLLLDDADRADPASMRSLRLLGHHDQLGAAVAVLVIGDEPVDELDATLDRLEQHGVALRHVHVPPLDDGEIAELLAAGLGGGADQLAPLARAVQRRSDGSPELAINDVWALIAEGHVRLDATVGRWVWDDRAIRDADPLTAIAAARRRLAELSAAERDVVVAAALCERAATTAVLAAALHSDVGTIEHAISRAVEARILVPRVGIDGVEVVACADTGVRDAVLHPVDQRRRSELGLALGRAVMSTGTGSTGTGSGRVEAMSDERRFEAVRLLSGSLSLVTDPAELAEFVTLVDQAARAAHRASGYQVALDLQLRAIEVLGASGWLDQPDLTFALHLHAAEHALMLGRAELVDELLDTIATHDPTPQQRVAALRVLSWRWWTRQDAAEGLAEARSLLRALGEPIPDRPTWADVAREFVATRRALVDVDPDSFLAAPRLEDERLRAVNETMIRCVHLAYVSDPMTHVVLALRGTRLTARHGVDDGSAYFLTAYAMLSCAFRTDVDRGLGFGRVGMQLARRTGGGTETMVTFAYNAFVRHWGEPLADTIAPLLRGYESALAAHERGYGLTGGTFGVLHAVLAGRPLRAVSELADGCSAEFERLGEAAFANRVDLVRQAVADLRTGYQHEPLDGDLFAATPWLAARRRHDEKALIVHTLRALVAACHDDRAAMRRFVEAGAPMVRTAPGQAIVGVHWYLAGLAAADQLKASRSLRQRMHTRLRAERARRWLRSWKPHSTSGVAHRLALVEAAIADAAGHDDVAMHGYELAIQLAQRHDSLVDVGLAAQRAAAFHARRPGSTLVDHYAQIAHDAWQAWGASAVAASLNDRHPVAATRVASASPVRPPRDMDGMTTPTSPASDAFAQASRLMGEELAVHEFLERLVEILLDHTAADRGFLVLQSASGPVVEAAAERTTDGVESIRLGSATLDDHPDLCVPALTYAFRTRETLSIVEPATDNRFRSDEQLRKRNPRALLCLPIGRASGTTGMLVLESDTFTHAFQADRIEALHVLSTQAISAVENARLTSDLGSLADDVALLRSRAAALTTQAETDPLTGVANRLGLAAAFRTSMRRDDGDDDGASTRRLGVLFCDLDEFKIVNDRHGHATGALVLRAVAERLRDVVRADDVVARVGGDEFVILSFDLPTDELDAISQRALHELRRPFELAGGLRIVLSASIGVAEASFDAVDSTEDIDEVLRIADQAMYRAKNAGKDRVARGDT